MDQNSDDSTDDESAPRKPIPSWAESKFSSSASRRDCVRSDRPERLGAGLNPPDSALTVRSSPSLGHNLHQIIMKQYFNPPDLDSFFGVIEPPKLEDIFYKSKPRYFKRTSSAVWHLPPPLPM